MADSLRTDHRFGSSDPLSIGVEEELFLVHPLTGRLANTSAAVLERLEEVDGTVEQELHACQVELITNICRGAAAAVHALGEMRAAVLASGVGILAAGTHPPRGRVRPRSRIKSAMSGSITCSAMLRSRRSERCTCMSACQTPRPRSARSTGCAARSRC